MALTPHKALEMIALEDKEIVARLEQNIDEAIRKDYQGAGNTVTYFLEDNVPARALNTVKEIYEKAGWKVESNYDMRDGAWLTLTERRTRDIR